MDAFNLFCRTATTFAPDRSFDENAFSQYLSRFVDARIGVYLGSLGSGESGSMTHDELRRVYETGVRVCKGKIPVNANPPEKLSIRETLEHVQIAVDAGVDIVNVYGPATWHGYQPTLDEFFAFFDSLLQAVETRVAFSPYVAVGLAPTPPTIAELCQRYPQIVALNLMGQRDEYFIEVKDRLSRNVAINVQFAGSFETLMLGASAVIGAEMNMIPKTYRRYMDLFVSGDYAEAARVYADIARFNGYVRNWQSAHPRWIKMMMAILEIPGAAIREPYLPSTQAQRDDFGRGLFQLNLPEVNELARKIGLVA